MTRRPVDDRDRLLAVAVAGRIAPARISVDISSVDSLGRPVLLPGNGGIALGVHVGDRAAEYLADHLMVGVSIEDEGDRPAVAGPLHQLACLGDVVRDAAAVPIGVIAGKRGGLAPGFVPPQLVAVETTDDRMEGLFPGDRVVLEAFGRGLSFPDHPDVAILNLSPTILDELALEETDGGLVISVRHVVPATAAGAGLGQDGWIGDIEIADAGALSDAVALRFGDLVAITELDGRVSRYPSSGWLSVGVVSHGPSLVPGHGIGLTLLLTGPAERVQLRRSAEGSLAKALRGASERVAARPGA
jgi:hypothetical protein